MIPSESSVFGTAVAVIKAVDGYLETVENAPESCKLLLRELSFIQSTLESINNATTDQGNIADEGLMGDLQTTLNEILGWLQLAGGEKMSRTQRFQWPLRRHQKKIDGFLKDLERYKSLYTLALANESRYVDQ